MLFTVNANMRIHVNTYSAADGNREKQTKLSDIAYTKLRNEKLNRIENL